MFSRTRRSLLLILPFIFTSAAFLRAADVPARDVHEAERLYKYANDFVNNITEKEYSYEYIQFHWKRAQSNVDRIFRDYADTPVGQKLRSGELKLGPYELTYFKERVLPRLEEKRQAAFDAVNCCVFLYTRHTDDDPERLAALQKIVEVLSRQKRWSEALSFQPVLDVNRHLKYDAIFRVAARFGQDKMVDELFKIVSPAEQTELWPLLGEAFAIRGVPRTQIAKLLDEHSENEVKLGILCGMAERETKIQRAAALRVPEKNIYLAGGALENPSVRDDVDAVANTFFPSPIEASAELLDAYHAGLGRKPAADAPASVHTAYIDYLGAFEKFDELSGYLALKSLSPDARQACALKAIEVYARAGRLADAERLRAPFVVAEGPLADTATLAEFRGQINSTEVPLTVRERTFSRLPIKDPDVLAQAIMEWSLTPNRAIRGAPPWDSVVQKFLPGFDDLPLPKSKAVQDAAGTSKPF